MPNHLAGETSPYLLQHAENPVDWYPWGEEALEIARMLDKPILLSIGYSACHWCHVMAHESFEDAQVATAMNEHFVNIKVDREERPDIDQIYQSAHYTLNHRSGGWPLTMFLTPEQKPFFGGTYFPKEARYSMPGFLELLPKVAELYRTRKTDIEKQNAVLLKLLAQSLPAPDTRASALSRQPIDRAWEQLNRLFDETDGGFGDAPKFLHPAELQFCLRRYVTDNDTRALHVVTHTLEKMAQGGLYDQLGGGFCRYSTDHSWQIPHFEKMLYDNALMLPLYAETWLVTGNPLFKQVVEETAAWVIREMQSGMDGEGGYFSSLDADSEHEEGKFYVWDRQAVSAILTPEEYRVTAAYYGLDRSPNFENHHWHLAVTESIETVAARHQISQEAAQQLIDSARRKLLNEREQRIRPGRDEKILTSWNALMIKGMTRAGQIFEREEWISSAVRALDFIRSRLWQDDRLLATFKDDKAHLNAYLDDHAFLLDSLLTLLQADFRQTDLDFAITLADVLLTRFEDKTSGGFFFTSHDHETLIHRPKTGHDGAIPAGNGIAATTLQRLGHLLNEQRYLEAAERTLNVFSSGLSLHASSHCSLLITLEEFLEPTKTVILHGNRPELQIWLKALLPYSLDKIVIALPLELSELPDSLKMRSTPDGKISARVCEGRRCLPEIHSLNELLQMCKLHGRMALP